MIPWNQIFTVNNMLFFILGFAGTLLIIAILKWITDKSMTKEDKEIERKING